MNRIKELRQSKKLRQSDLAVELQVSQATLSNWESGRYEPDFDALKKMSDFFQVSVDYLLGRDEKKLAPISESELDAELIERLCNLTPEEKDKVDAFVQGLLASRSD